MTKQKLLLDTDILIDYLRGIPLAVQFLEETIVNSICYVSSITIAELYVGVRDSKERHILDQLIQEFQSIVINEEIAKMGGLIRRDYGKSHGVGLADAIIAASAKSHSLTLVTRNKKHYPMLRNVHVPYQRG